MQKLPLQTKIALRNIFRQPRRSLLTILAISFSVFCIILFQSLKVGMHRKMIEGALSLDHGTMQVHAESYEPNITLFQSLPDFAAVRQKLEEKGITDYSLRIKAPALLLSGPRSSSVLLTGIIPEQEKNVTLIHSRMTAGRYVSNNTESLVVGRVLAESLKLRVGDKVTLMLQDVYGKPAIKKIEIGGLYDTGLSSFDLTHIYLPLATLQNLLKADNEITEIAAWTRPGRAEQLAAGLSAELDREKYKVTPWQEMAPDLVQLMELNNATFNLLVIIIFLIVAMGIANTMNSVIFERFREFGTIAAIGTTPAEIVTLVSLESSFLGVFACLVGTITALLACTYLHFHGIDLSGFTSSNQYFAAGSILKAFVLPQDIVAANLVTLITAVIAGLYPAGKAARLRPVDALNYT